MQIKSVYLHVPTSNRDFDAITAVLHKDHGRRILRTGVWTYSVRLDLRLDRPFQSACFPLLVNKETLSDFHTLLLSRNYQDSRTFVDSKQKEFQEPRFS